jgi:hypothetical protein
MTVINVTKTVDLQYSEDDREWYFVKYPEFVSSTRTWKVKEQALQAYRDGKVKWEN